MDKTVVFPRGKGNSANSSLHAEEVSTKKALSLNQRDLFGSENKRVKRIEVVQKDRRTKGGKPTKLLPSIGLGIVGTGENVDKVPYVGEKDFKAGAQFLGFVLSITEVSALISCPNGFIATLAKEEVSDVVYNSLRSMNEDSDEDIASFDHLISPYQPLRCCVLPHDPSSNDSRPAVSCRGSLVNRGLALKHLLPGFALSCALQSIEDHGYILNAGLEGVHFFLPKHASKDKELTIGQPLECIVHDMNVESRTVTLRLRADDILEEVVANRSMPFVALTPGMLFNVVLEKKLPSGLLVSYLNLFHGMIDRQSLTTLYSDAEWSEVTMEKKLLKARIVFVDHANKTVRLSQRPHVMLLHAPVNLPAIGSIIEDTQVMLASKRGVYLRRTDDDITSDDTLNDMDEEAANERDEEGKEKKINRKERRRMEAAELVKLESQVQYFSIADKALATRIPSSSAVNYDEDDGDENDDDKVEGEEHEGMVVEDDDNEGDGHDEEEEAEATKVPTTNQADNKSSRKPSKSSFNNKQAKEEELEEGKRINNNYIVSSYPIHDTIPQIRIRGYKLVENISLASNLSEYLTSTITHISDLQVGQIHTVTVLQIRDFGLKVQITGSKITAICSTYHTSDAASVDSKLTKKFKVGQKLKMRVLEVDFSSSDKTRVSMTAKKSLLDDPNKKSLIFQIDDALIGTQTLGTVTQITNEGISVNFFNKIYGFLSSIILSKQGIVDPVSSYHRGQLIEVVIIHKSLYQKKGAARPIWQLFLALDMNLSDELISSYADLVRPAHEAGAGQTDEKHEKSVVVSGTIFRYESDSESYLVRLTDGRTGRLPCLNIFDFVSSLQSMDKGKVLEIGQIISQAVVLQEDKENGMVILTTKPLLLLAATTAADSKSADDTLGMIPSSIDKDNLQAGQVIIGIVHKVAEYGIIIRCKNFLSGLVPRAQFADTFTKTAEGLFAVGDSIRCVIQRVDINAKKMFLTLKNSLIPTCKSVNYISAYFKERFISAQHAGKLSLEWKKYGVGSIITATVSSVEEYGIVFLADDQHTLLLSRNLSDTVQAVMGEEMKVLIADIDFEHKIFIVQIITDKATIKAYKNSLKLDFTLSSATASPLSMTVTGIDSERRYLIVQTIINTESKTKEKAVFISGFVSLVDYHMPKTTQPNNLSFNVGDLITCTVIEKENSDELVFPHQKANYFRLVTSNPNQQQQQVAVSQAQQTKSKSKGQATTASADDDSDQEEEEQHEAVVTTTTTSLKVMPRTGQVSTWTITAISPTEITLTPTAAVAIAGAHIIGKISLFMTLHSYTINDKLAEQLARSKTSNEIRFDQFQIGQEVMCQNCRVSSTVIHLRLLPETSEKIMKPRIPSYFLHFITLQHLHQQKMTVCKGIIVKLKEHELRVMVSPGLILGISYFELTKNPELRRQFLTVAAEKSVVGMSVTFLAVSQSGASGSNNNSSSTEQIFCSRAMIEDYLEGSEHGEGEIQELQSQLQDENSEFFKSIPPVTTASSPNKKSLMPGDIVFGTISLSTFRNGSFTIELDHMMHTTTTIAKVDFTEVDNYNHWQDYSEVETMIAEKKWSEMKCKGYLYHGARVRCVVLSVDTNAKAKQGSVITVSLRPSRLYDTNSKTRIKVDSLPTQGSLVSGYVTAITDKGCFIRLSTIHTGRAMIRDLSDDFLPNPKEVYPVGKLITAARVKTVDHLTGHIQLDCKPSVISHNQSLKSAIDKLNRASNKITTGIIDSINTNLGLFIRLEHYSPIIGLARTVTALQNPAHTLQDEYQVGDKVQVRVLKVSTKSMKVMLGLREKYFRSDYVLEEIYRNNDEQDEPVVESATEEDLQVTEANSNSRKKKKEQVKQIKAGIIPTILEDTPINIIEDEEVEGEHEVSNKKAEKEKKGSKKRKASDEDKEAEPPVIDETAVTTILEPKKKQKKTLLPTTLPVTVAAAAMAVVNDDDLDLVWDTNNTAIKQSTTNTNKRSIDDTLNDSDSDAESNDGTKASKKKARKHDDHNNNKLAERTLRERELALAEGRLLPESVDDFERLIIAQPNSSFLWVKYLAFHVQAADIDAARVIANRALRTIHFREEDEKFNVWIALLNMEHRYGTKESFDTALRQAVSESKGKRIYLSMAASLEQAGDISNAEQLFERALKAPQFRKSKKVWMAYHSLLLRAAGVDSSKTNDAKKELARALQSLSQHKHLEVIKHFALAEFDYGSIDRGRVLFEDMLSNYPKRTDLWHIYVDKEAKLNHIQEARQLFERMITLKTSAKNMKAIFKKYLFFESRFGDEQTQEMVKEKARDYVNSLA